MKTRTEMFYRKINKWKLNKFNPPILSNVASNIVLKHQPPPPKLWSYKFLFLIHFSEWPASLFLYTICHPFPHLY